MFSKSSDFWQLMTEELFDVWEGKIGPKVVLCKLGLKLQGDGLLNVQIKLSSFCFFLFSILSVSF